MPKREAIRKAEKAKRAGKAPSTQAGEFVRQEIDEVREGKHGARSVRQAIAIGLSEARRAGVKLPPPAKGRVKESTRKSAEYAYEVGQGERKPKRHPRISRAGSEVLQGEPRNTVSRSALSAQTKSAAKKRGAASRSAAAKKAARTKGQAARTAAAKKAAKTRARQG